MIPVYNWPTIIHSVPSTHHDSNSKIKRSALNFLSSILVGEEPLQETMFETSNDHKTTEDLSLSEKDIVPIVIPPELGGGMRFAGDVRTKYIVSSNVKTEKSHRLFLSWDRAYPAMVVSLVVPAHSTVNTKTQAKSSTLLVPRDEEHFHSDRDSLDGAMELSSRDSSSEVEDSHHHDSFDKKKHKGISFGFLLHQRAPGPNENNEHGTNVGSILGTSPPGQGNVFDNDSPPTRRRKIDDIDDEPGSTRKNIHRHSEENSWDTEYSFHILDDSKINQGKHRVIPNLASTRMSILPYIKTKVLKEELNLLFRKQNPNLPEDLTLSKLRKLKKELLERAKECDCELSTVALSYVYLEKLILKGVVHKANRKVVAFACLILAFKFNESDLNKFKLLLSEISKENKISSSEIFSVEFAVFAHLRFNLNLHGSDYFEHFIRVMRIVDVAPSEYLKETHEEVSHLLKLLAKQKKISQNEIESRSSNSSNEDEEEETLNT